MDHDHPDRGDVRLRALRPGDGDDIVDAVSDPELIRYTRVPAPYASALAGDFIEACRPSPGEAPRTLALAVPAPGHPAGRLVGVVGLDVDDRDGNAELGYWTARGARGRGLTTWGAREVCRYGFEVLGLARIHLMASVENPASNGIAARLGFHRLGVARAAMLHRAPDGSPISRGDATMWDLLPGELA